MVLMNRADIGNMFKVDFERGWVECKLCPKHPDGTSHTGRAFDLVEESWYLYHAKRHISGNLRRNKPENNPLTTSNSNNVT
jgi:hypothetical protein